MAKESVLQQARHQLVQAASACFAHRCAIAGLGEVVEQCCGFGPVAESGPRQGQRRVAGRPEVPVRFRGVAHQQALKDRLDLAAMGCQGGGVGLKAVEAQAERESQPAEVGGRQALTLVVGFGLDAVLGVAQEAVGGA